MTRKLGTSLSAWGVLTLLVAFPAGASASPTARAAAEAPMDAASVDSRLRDLEARVDELRDKIRHSQIRIQLIDSISHPALGSRAEISLENQLSTAFRLVKATVVVDGAVAYSRSDETGALADQKTIPVFAGPVPPGDHTVQVVLHLNGNGYGVFTYLRSYHFDLSGKHTWSSVEGSTLALTVSAYEKEGVTTVFSDRPALEFHEKVLPLAPAAAASK